MVGDRVITLELQLYNFRLTIGPEGAHGLDDEW